MSEIRKILLPLNTLNDSEPALSLAIILAKRFVSHVCVLNIYLDKEQMTPMVEEGFPGSIIGDLLSNAEETNEEQSVKLQKLFMEVAKHNKVPIIALPSEIPHRASASFQIHKGLPYKIATYYARVSDLGVVPHPDNGDDYSSSEILHSILFDSGRPVIIAPRVRVESVGERVCIAWNSTSQAAVALKSSLPFACRAKAVHVLHCSDNTQSLGPSAQEAVNYLQLHGITAKLHEFSLSGRNAGKGLLKASDMFKADLLCMGAYSKSRLRQMILGGVSRYVLENARIPVMMSR